MSMLAETRKRKKYVIHSRSKPLYEDENRFGTKLLKKMGWSEGKGLGAREEGTIEFIRVRFKHDNTGLGFEDRNDHWKQHEEGFNDLLMGLNKNSSLGEETEKKVVDGEGKLKDGISGVSLEKQSKKSRTRVHYQKFTKNKDLSQYSEKDLANIFGKKTEEKVENYKAEENELESSIEQKKVLTINTGISVADYFKNKMQKLKEKYCFQTVDSKEVEEIPAKRQRAISVEVSSNGFTAGKDMEPNKNQAEKGLDEAKPRKETKKVRESDCNLKGNHPPTDSKKNLKSDKLGDLVRSKEEESKSTNYGVANNTTDTVKNMRKQKKNKYKEGSEEKDDDNVVISTIETVKMNDHKDRSEEKKRKDFNQIEMKEENNFVKFSGKKKCKSENLKENVADENARNSVQYKNLEKQEDQAREIEDAEPTKRKKKKKNKGKDHEREKDEDAKLIEEVHNESATQEKEAPEGSDKNNKAAKSSLKVAVPLDDANTYIISLYTAEKFRHLDWESFKGSSLPHITGYGLSENFNLEVRKMEEDEARIIKLWIPALNKYGERDDSINSSYSSYMKGVLQSRKHKTKQPKLNVKTLHRKTILTGI